MIKVNNNLNIDSVYLGRLLLVAVYHGSDLIWQAVRSCFGSGIWILDKPWLDDEFWKNNK